MLRASLVLFLAAYGQLAAGLRLDLGHGDIERPVDHGEGQAEPEQTTEQKLKPVKTTWIDEDKDVRAIETTCGLDFIIHMYKAAPHAPQHMKAEVDMYMKELIGENWSTTVTDPDWKPNKKQKGQQFSRMFAVKMSNDKGILLYSPINIKAPGALEAINEMGNLTVIILPNSAHYIHAYGWQLKFPWVKIYGVRNWAPTAKCSYYNSTWQVNPIACAAGGEAPMELGGFSGPASMWSNKDGESGVVNKWSPSSVPLLWNKHKEVPSHLDEDFTIFSFQGDKMTEEFIFYHKKSKSLLAADWLYVGTALSMREEWTWSTDAKLFALMMAYGSPSPALPLYRAFKSGGSTMSLFSEIYKPAQPDEEDIFLKVFKTDMYESHKLIKAVGYEQGWKQMKHVVDQILALDLGTVLLCHAKGFPKGDFAKQVIRATWGFLTNNIYCCCKSYACQGSEMSEDGITPGKTSTIETQYGTALGCCVGKNLACDDHWFSQEYHINAPNTTFCQP